MKPQPPEDAHPEHPRPQVPGAATARKVRKAAEAKANENPDQQAVKVWDRINQIRPRTPKVPFATALHVSESHEQAPPSGHSTFVSRSKKHSRSSIWVAIAVVLTLIAVIASLVALAFLNFL